MPKIPTYGNRRVETAPLPNARVLTDAPANTFAPVDIGPAASIVAQVAEKQALDNDEMVVNARERELEDFRIDQLQNPETGYLHRKGINALTAKPDAEEAWAKKVSELTGKLQNDRQREAFQRRERGRYSQLVEQVAAHTSAEMRKADAATIKAFLDDGLATVHTAPEKAGDVIRDAQQRLVEFKGREGWTPDVLKQKAAAHISDIHNTTIEAFVARAAVTDPERSYQDAQQAQAYFNAHKDELYGEQRTAAEKLVNAAVVHYGGLNDARAILGLTKDTTVVPSEGQRTGEVVTAPAAAESLGEALARVEAIPDESRRAVAAKAVTEHFRKVDETQRVKQKATFDRMSDALEASHGQINEASPDWLALSHNERQNLLHRQEQIRYPKERGDPETFTALLNLAAFPNSRDEFLAENILQHKNLSTKERVRLLDLQRQYSGKAPKAAKGANPALQLTADSPFANVSTEPAHPSNPLDGILSEAKQPTQQMLDDIVKHGEGYADTLRVHGYVVPTAASLRAQQEAQAAKEKKKP